MSELIRIDPAQVRDAQTGDLLGALVGQHVQVVARETADPYPIHTQTGDPIADSRVTVTPAIDTPAVYLLVENLADIAEVYLDWYDATSERRGPITMEQQLRRAAQDAAMSSAASAASSASSASSAAAVSQGVVRQIGDLLPDADGRIDGVIGGSPPVIGMDAPPPEGLPAWGVVLRVEGGPTPGPAVEVGIVAGSRGTVRGTGDRITVSTPSGTAAGQMLIAKLTHQNAGGLGPLPAGWVMLHTLSEPSVIRTTVIVALPITNPAAVSGDHVFTPLGGGGRYCAEWVLATGLDLAAPPAATSAPATVIADGCRIPAMPGAPAGSLVIAVSNAQILAGAPGVPASISHDEATGTEPVMSSDTQTATRTGLASWWWIVGEGGGTPALDVTWTPDGAGAGVSSAAGLAVALAAAP